MLITWIKKMLPATKKSMNERLYHFPCSRAHYNNRKPEIQHSDGWEPWRHWAKTLPGEQYLLAVTQATRIYYIVCLIEEWKPYGFEMSKWRIFYFRVNWHVMPNLLLKENWMFTIVLLYYRHTIFLFDTVKLLWHNLYY